MLNRYSVHHILFRPRAFPIATRVAFIIAVDAVVRGIISLKDLFVFSLESVLVVEINVRPPQVVLVDAAEAFFLPWLPIQSDRGFRGLKHFILSV